MSYARYATAKVSRLARGVASLRGHACVLIFIL